jgi:L-alanine-DL-glutamate epimerase-like enolase superfamily enzyme
VLEAAMRVSTKAGKEAVGFGSMTMGSTWAFPSRNVESGLKLELMKELAQKTARTLPSLSGGEYLHPLDWGHLLETWLKKEVITLSEGKKLADPFPLLAGLVTASPFDAALHDGFGKANQIDCYNGYSDEYADHDLSYYLDQDFKDEYLDAYTCSSPKSEMPLYHLVGALDPLAEGDVAERIDDGFPETLYEWIAKDGLTHLKIKLNGDDLKWDVDRVASVNRVAEQIESDYGPREWAFSLDFNEQCENVEYLVEFLARIKEVSPSATDRVQYIEQPTHRDLEKFPGNKMHAASAVKPVVIDESLLDYETLLLSEEMGYSGVALKACKGQSQSLLLGAAAQKRDRFLCVQDLTCVSTNFMHSASLAAHIPAVAAIEGNGRQYCPKANEEVKELFPDVFTVTNGRIKTGPLAGIGLCGVSAEYGKARYETMGK